MKNDLEKDRLIFGNIATIEYSYYRAKELAEKILNNIDKYLSKYFENDDDDFDNSLGIVDEACWFAKPEWNRFSIKVKNYDDGYKIFFSISGNTSNIDYKLWASKLLHLEGANFGLYLIIDEKNFVSSQKIKCVDELHKLLLKNGFKTDNENDFYYPIKFETEELIEIINENGRQPITHIDKVLEIAKQISPELTTLLNKHGEIKSK